MLPDSYNKLRPHQHYDIRTPQTAFILPLRARAQFYNIQPIYQTYFPNQTSSPGSKITGLSIAPDSISIHVTVLPMLEAQRHLITRRKSVDLIENRYKICCIYNMLKFPSTLYIRSSNSGNTKNCGKYLYDR